MWLCLCVGVSELVTSGMQKLVIVNFLLLLVAIAVHLGLSAALPTKRSESVGITVADPHGPHGVWKKHVVWKARWIKEWKQVKVWKATWKKVWGPVEIQEWVPIPKPPVPLEWEHQQEATNIIKDREE